MRTTLNIPDDLVKKAKQLALRDGVTLTDMLVHGLTQEVQQAEGTWNLPISVASGGLLPGIQWEKLRDADGTEDWYR